MTAQSKRKQPWKPSKRDLRIYLEYAKGSKSQPQVAEEFGLSQPRVCTILKMVQDWMWNETMHDIRLVKMQQVQSLTYIYREAMRAWERSKTASRSLSTKKSDGKVTEQTRSLKSSQGDPKYLDIAMKALADIREVTGANAPVEIRHTGELRVAGLSLRDAILQKKKQLDERLLLLTDDRNGDS